jgi:hypothetical protein
MAQEKTSSVVYVKEPVLLNFRDGQKGYKAYFKRKTPVLQCSKKMPKPFCF